MARKSKRKKVNIFVYILALIIGVAGGAVGMWYMSLPYTEELIIGEEPFYSYNDHGEIEKVSLTGGDDEFSIHFIEVGNKYTGDCTYIKYGNVDILVDCGSRTSSVSTVKQYLDSYMTDNILDYVIVTHAHQDHYAGFATGTNAKSIFDHYECSNIITFATTNQKGSAEYSDNGITSYAKDNKPESRMYNNFNRELKEEITAGANHYTAAEIISDSTTFPEGKIELDSTRDVNIQILKSHYYTNKATSENDYSVCTMFNYGDRYFLLTGDLEIEGEEELVEMNPIFEEIKNNGKDYGVDVYKAGHHGSKTSSGDKLLEYIRPKTICVCCCAGSPEYTDTKDNQFPTQEFINRVTAYTLDIYVTTLCVDYDKDEYTSMNGNIVFVVTAETFGINCSNNDIKLTETDWFKANRTLPTD